MTNRPIPELDTFETRLLRELMAVVTDQAAAEATAPPSPPAPVERRTPNAERRTRRGWYVPLAGAVAAAAVGVMLVTAVARPTPAYAVTGGNGEQVIVTITRLEGAQALEDALRERGIPADITYLSPGTVCAPGRFTDVTESGLTVSVGANLFEVVIPPGAVGEDNTFVLSAAVQPTQNGVTRSSVDFGVAEGVVAPCTVVDAP